MSGDQPRKRRLLSVIKGEDQRELLRQQNKAAFEKTLDLYIKSRFECPLVRSALAFLDETNPSTRHGWTANVAIFCVDCEKAAHAALGDSPALLDKLYEWFIAPEIERGVDPPSKLTLDEQNKYNRIVQRCGAEFRRRKIY